MFYRFQGRTHHSCSTFINTDLKGHHDKSSNHLTPYHALTISLIRRGLFWENPSHNRLCVSRYCTAGTFRTALAFPVLTGPARELTARGGPMGPDQGTRGEFWLQELNSPRLRRLSPPKAAEDNTYTDRHGCIPAQFYLQTQTREWRSQKQALVDMAHESCARASGPPNGERSVSGRWANWVPRAQA